MPEEYTGRTLQDVLDFCSNTAGSGCYIPDTDYTLREWCHILRRLDLTTNVSAHTGEDVGESPLDNLVDRLVVWSRQPEGWGNWCNFKYWLRMVTEGNVDRHSWYVQMNASNTGRTSFIPEKPEPKVFKDMLF